VTLPTTLRDSIFIVGPPLSALSAAGAAGGLATGAEAGNAPAAGATALALVLAGSPDAIGGAGAADAGAGGTVFSIAAS
jgi:hypothetical protein